MIMPEHIHLLMSEPKIGLPDGDASLQAMRVGVVAGWRQLLLIVLAVGIYFRLEVADASKLQG